MKFINCDRQNLVFFFIQKVAKLWLVHTYGYLMCKCLYGRLMKCLSKCDSTSL